jgi:hypothetical protein
MKKLLLILPVLVCACMMINKTLPPPAEKICKEGSFEVNKTEVIQLANDAALVVFYKCYKYDMYVGKNVSDETCSESWNIQAIGEKFAVPKKNLNNWNDLYDGRFVAVGFKCATIGGTYRYTDTTGAQRTIQAVTYIGDPIPNPAYKEWQKEQEK